MNQLRLLSRIFYEFRLLSAFDVLRNLRTVHSFRYSEANTMCATQREWVVSVVYFQLKRINNLFIFRLSVIVLVFYSASALLAVQSAVASPSVTHQSFFARIVRPMNALQLCR